MHDMKFSKRVKYSWRILRIFLLSYVGFIVIIMIFEEKLIFFPTKWPNGRWHLLERPIFGESALNYSITEEWFTTSDGVRLHGWYGSISSSEIKDSNTRFLNTVVLWCHGNAGNITDRYEQFVSMMEIPVNVFIFDYRGYGRSEGNPIEKGMYLDVAAAWDLLQDRYSYQPESIIVYGVSLGGVGAINLAATKDVAGLIIQSSFTSIRDMASLQIPFIPPFLIRTQMDSLSKIPDLKCPKLFIHGTADEIIPFKQGRRLFEAAKEPKDFYAVENGTHNETVLTGSAECLSVVKGFIRSCIGAIDEMKTSIEN